MSRVGDDLVEAFDEMAAYLRGDAPAEHYDTHHGNPPLGRGQHGSVRGGVSRRSRALDSADDTLPDAIETMAIRQVRWCH